MVIGLSKHVVLTASTNVQAPAVTKSLCHGELAGLWRGTKRVMIAAETPGAVPPVSEVPASQQPMDSSQGQTENDGRPTRSSTSPVSTTATPPPHDDTTATEVDDPAILEAQKMIAACAGGDNSTIVMMVSAHAYPHNPVAQPSHHRHAPSPPASSPTWQANATG